YLTLIRSLPRPPLSPYTTLFRSQREDNPLSAFANLFSQAFTGGGHCCFFVFLPGQFAARGEGFSQLGFQIYPVSHHYNTALLQADRKSTRLNSSHVKTSYAVFCL